MENGKIEITDSHTSFVGRSAVEVFRLATIISALKFEIKTGMKMSRVSALKAAKQITGTNGNKQAQLPLLEKMLEEAKAAVEYSDTSTKS
jgi:hypothetical protein